MKAIKILSILIIMFGFYKCKSSKLDKKPPFLILSAIHYPQENTREKEVYVKYSSQDFVEFDSLFFQERKAKIEVKTMRGNTYAYASFKPILKQDIILDSNSIKELNNSVPKTQYFPFILQENEAIISYKIKGKTKFFKIYSVKTQKTSSF